MKDNHTHKFEKQGNYWVCECGAKRLCFNGDDVRVGMRSNGRKYTKKTDVNRYLFPNEFLNIYEKLTTRMKFCVRCLINTGGRINEVRQIDWDKDFFSNQGGRNIVILKHTKTKARKGEFDGGKVRNIPVSKQFARFINTTEHQKFVSTAAVCTALKVAATKAKIRNPEDLSAHTLRKTLEVWLMSLGVKMLPLTAHMGHDPSTAAAYYISADVFSYNDKQMMRTIIGDLYSW
jgi:integrase